MRTLRKRKYPEKILYKAVERVLNINREELLKPKEVQEDTRICYIIIYNPRNPNMKEISYQHLHILAKMRKNPITNEQVQTVYRKSRNLRDLLITGIVNPKPPQKQRCIPCRDIRGKSYLTCNRLSYSNSVTSTDNVSLKIRGNFTCQSRNCVYSLTCNCCGKKYIGESFQTINLRMRGHESHIRYWRKHPRTPVAQHFGTKNLNEKEYTLEILDQEQDKNKRNQLEEAWIFLLNTITPSGLNSKW